MVLEVASIDQDNISDHEMVEVKERKPTKEELILSEKTFNELNCLFIFALSQKKKLCLRFKIWYINLSMFARAHPEFLTVEIFV